ncbi:MATE family efflux transporter, partial [Acinetobacter baumannii]|nr:MATE family efflux transporter [Acinetobacter baumannii]
VIFGFINLATSILCAQFIGARNKKKVQEVITVSLIVNLLLGLLMGALYFGFWELILQKINLPLELVDIGKTYFKLVGGLCVFQAITLT